MLFVSLLTTSMTRWTKKLPYSVAQDRFVQRTRHDIDANQCSYFDDHDWHRIVPNGGSRSSLRKAVSIDSFYVKPVAAWVPHLLFENHVPSCPRCRSPRFVDVKAARWINTPKILFGVSSHQYLDTKLYPCRGCGQRFTGYNRESMDLDEEKYMGFFNIYLSARFAVNEDLASFITNMYDKSTASIHRVLTQMATDRYLNDHIYYLHACRANKIKKRADNVAANGQSTLDPLLQDVSDIPEAPAAQRTLLRLQKDFQRTRFKLGTAETAARNNLCFRELFKSKNGRNRRHAPLPSVGTGKLQKFIDAGIESGRDLVDYNGIHPSWNDTPRRRVAFCQLRRMVQDLFSTKQKTVDALLLELDTLQSEINRQQDEVDLQLSHGLIELAGRDDERQQLVIQALEKKNPVFSKMTDCDGYNARIISSVAKTEEALCFELVSMLKEYIKVVHYHGKRHFRTAPCH